VITQASLWDAEDEITIPKVREMQVRHVSVGDVDEFCQRYHYTRTGGNRTWRYGLWSGPTLWGVVAYNLPTPDVCRSVFGAKHGPEHVWHMGRLVLPDHAPRNSESRLIGGSLRLIERGYPDVWGVLTYAATDAGHIGYVYQATNAIYIGQGGRYVFFVDQEGRRRGGHNGGHVSNAQALSQGWAVMSAGVKHRYVYILGNKRERRQRLALLRFPALPYPKVIGELAGET
jgi:hypothetical protein